MTLKTINDVLQKYVVGKWKVFDVQISELVYEKSVVTLRGSVFPAGYEPNKTRTYKKLTRIEDIWVRFEADFKVKGSYQYSLFSKYLYFKESKGLFLGIGRSPATVVIEFGASGEKYRLTVSKVE